jgi:hypothetical protein
MNYYYLIAGLPDIKIEDNKLTYSVASFKEEVRPRLSTFDLRLMDMFFMKFDNQNLLQYLKNTEAKFDERGHITKDEMEEYFRLFSDVNEPKYKNFLSYFKPKAKYFPPYIKTFLSEYRNADDTDAARWENRLTELYYQWAMNCGNKFISNWFEFNLNLNNILAAFSSRKYKMNVEVLGNNAVSIFIKTSKQRDFGLSAIIEDMDIFQRIADETDLFEREKKIDLLKWKWLEDKTFFKYFSIEILFAYLAKLEIIERWISLDPVEGEKVFRSLINDLKSSVVNSPESINLQMNEL